MPLGDSILARGSLLVDLSTPQSRKYLRYEIRRTGIQFFELGKPANLAAIDGFGLGAIASVKGHALLAALPTAPRATFPQVKLTASPTQIALTIESPGSFAATPDLSYKQLSLTFTQQKSPAQLTVSGSVTAVLYGQELTLLAQLTDDRGLVFAYSPNVGLQTIAIAALGTLNLSKFELSASTDPWAGLQALYLFDPSTFTVNPASITLYDSSGTQDPLDLQIAPDATGKAPVLDWSNGLAIDAKTPPIRSTGPAKKINAACKRSDEVTLEAWIQPQSIGTNPPGRIITLSLNQSQRNATLQQGFLAGSPSVYSGFARTDPGKPNGEPAIQSPIAAISGIDHVVFTRDKTGLMQLYVNGVAVPAFNCGGTLNAWEDYALTLGNEFQPVGINTPSIRPWVGQLHRIAIYDRALTAVEVRQRAVPTVDIQGTLLLDSVPAPLNAGVRVKIEQVAKTTAQPELSRITTDATVTLGTGNFQLKNLRWSWDKTATTLRLSRDVPDNGSVVLRLWEQEVNLVAQDIPGTTLIPALRLRSPELVLPLPGLGRLTGRRLNLTVDRTANPPAWIIETDAQLTSDVMPPPFRGPLSPLLSLTPEGQPQVQIRGAVDLADNLEIPQFQLVFARQTRGWEVRGSVEVRLFNRRFSLVPQFLTQADGSQTFSLNGAPNVLVPGGNPAAPADAATRTTLLLSSFRLLADAKPNPDEWQLTARGDVANFMQFQTQGTLAIAPPANTIRLRGTSALTILGQPVFQGDLQLRSQSVVLHGNWQFAPEWSPLQLRQDDVDIEILADGTVQFPDALTQNTIPVDFSLPNFRLLQPRLRLFRGRPQLEGIWLGAAIALQSFQKDGRLVWQGDVPFTLDLNLLAFPAMYERRSGVNLATLIPLSPQPDSSQQIRTNLTLELSDAGFMALARSQFVWQDETPTLNQVTLPDTTLLQTPETRNDLLRLTFEPLRADATTLLEPYLRHDADYFVTQRSNQSLIYYGDRTQFFRTLTLTLPPIFVGATSPVIGKSDAPANTEIFRLEQATTTTSTLTLQIPNLLLTDFNAGFAQIDQAYRDLLTQLWAREAGAGSDRPFLWGITLVQQRLAEHLPLPLEQVLTYYYGFNRDPGYVDLHPGMRLRVDYQDYQSVLPTDRSPERPSLSGFVSTTTAYYQLNRYARTLNNGAIEYSLGFDPFVSKLATSFDPTLVNNVSTSGAGGLVDLMQSSFRRPYYRLFYFRQVAGTTTSGRSERVASLVGSNSLADLNDATQEFITTGQITPTNRRVTFFFRGRALVIPEIQVFIHDQPTYVPIGTSIRRLLENFTDILPTTTANPNFSALPGAEPPRLPGPPRGQRLSHKGTTNTPTYRFLNLDTYASTINGSDALDLPVIKGDRFYF
jgi:Concanavalin A-like lectin/glucanases superfamily